MTEKTPKENNQNREELEAHLRSSYYKDQIDQDAWDTLGIKDFDLDGARESTDDIVYDYLFRANNIIHALKKNLAVPSDSKPDACSIARLIMEWEKILLNEHHRKQIFLKEMRERMDALVETVVENKGEE